MRSRLHLLSRKSQISYRSGMVALDWRLPHFFSYQHVITGQGHTNAADRSCLSGLDRNWCCWHCTYRYNLLSRTSGVLEDVLHSYPDCINRRSQTFIRINRHLPSMTFYESHSYRRSRLSDSERTQLSITPDRRKTLVFSRKSQETCL